MGDTMLKTVMKKGLLSFLLILSCLSVISYAETTPRVITDHALDAEQIERLDQRLEEFYQKTGIEFVFWLAEDVEQEYNCSSIQELLEYIYALHVDNNPNVKMIIVGMDEAQNSYYYDRFGEMDALISSDALKHIMESFLISYEGAGRLYEGISNTIDLVEAAVVKDDEDIKIFDFANLLSGEEEAKIRSRALALKKKYGMDFVFLFADGVDYSGEFRVYVLDLFHYSGYGYDGKKDGVFFALDMFGRDYAVVTTGKSQDAISDENLHKYGDRFISHLKEAEYYRAMDEYLAVLEGVLSGDIHSAEKQGKFMMGLLISAVVALLITGIAAYSQKIVIKKQNANEYVVPGSVHVTNRSDIYTHTTTTRRKIKSESKSGGGGSFSGSSGGSGGGISGKF